MVSKMVSCGTNANAIAEDGTIWGGLMHYRLVAAAFASNPTDNVDSPVSTCFITSRVPSSRFSRGFLRYPHSVDVLECG